MKKDKENKEIEEKKNKTEKVKKEKQPKVKKEMITRGAEQLGWELNELFEKTIMAMRAAEDEIEAELKKI